MDLWIPEFSPADPEIWFHIIESNFKTAGIVADSTKYIYVLNSIGSRYITEVRDITLDPPKERAYDVIKSELIKRLSLPQEQKYRLLMREEIGDCKPSQFLRSLRNLARNVDDKALQIIWTVCPRLFSHIWWRERTIRWISWRTPRIWLWIRWVPYRCGSRKPRSLRDRNDDRITALKAKLSAQLAQICSMNQDIAEQLVAMRKSIEILGESDQSRSGERRSPSRPRNRRTMNSLCWYHLEIWTGCKILCTALPLARASGKRNSPSLIAASDSGHPTRRLFVTDRNTRINFLIDTGADLCVYPRKMVQGPWQKSSYELSAANHPHLRHENVKSSRSHEDSWSRTCQHRLLVRILSHSTDYSSTYGTIGWLTRWQVCARMLRSVRYALRKNSYRSNEIIDTNYWRNSRTWRDRGTPRQANILHGIISKPRQDHL